MLVRTLIFMLLFSSVAFAGEQIKILPGELKKKSLADPFLVGLSDGPLFAKAEFEKLNLPNTQFDAAQYRVTYARHEIYLSIFVELIGLFEDLGRTVLNTYMLPLEEAYDIDRGNLKSVHWLSPDSFELIVERPDHEDAKLRVSALPNGQFKIERISTPHELIF